MQILHFNWLECQPWCSRTCRWLETLDMIRLTIPVVRSPCEYEPLLPIGFVPSRKSGSSYLFTLVTRQPYCPGRPKELCFTTLSLAMETMGMRLSVVKESFFGPPGQYGRRVTRANWIGMSFTSSTFSWTVWFLKKTRRRVGREVQHEKASW